MSELLLHYRFRWEDLKEKQVITRDRNIFKIFFKTVRIKKGESEKKQILFLRDLNTKENVIGEIDEEGELLFDDYEIWTEDELKTIKDEIIKVRRMLSWLCL